jgi:hypothetical protein
VQGVWCNGFGYHLAVSDANIKKDTDNNIEVIRRLLSSIYNKCGGLPMGLHVQQDNTSRECKNQFMISWAAKLVALGIFAWVTLAYRTTGRTHENIDGTCSGHMQNHAGRAAQWVSRTPCWRGGC